MVPALKCKKYLVGLILVKRSFHQIKYKVKEENKTLSCLEYSMMHSISKVSLQFISKPYNVFSQGRHKRFNFCLRLIVRQEGK